MTKEEAIKFLANKKVFVKDKSKEIQEKLFDLGFKWTKEQSQDVKYIDKPFIFIYDDGYITYSSDVTWFYDSLNEEITVEDILNITIKHKYRPFKNSEECWKEMLKHKPFGWLMNKKDKYYMIFAYIYHDSNFNSMTAIYNFADGTPFGIEED